MKRYCITIITLAITFSIHAQISNFHTFSGQPLMLKNGKDEAEGTTYLLEAWRTGSIRYDGNDIDNVEIRYNVKEDQAEILFKGSPFIPEKKRVSGFTIPTVEDGNTRYYRFKNGFEAEGISKDHYVAVLFEGRSVLVESFLCDEISVSSGSYSQKDTKRLVISKTMLLIHNGRATKIKPGKKAFITAFPEKEQSIKIFLKENPIDFTSVNDLFRLMEFIETKS